MSLLYKLMNVLFFMFVVCHHLFLLLIFCLTNIPLAIGHNNCLSWRFVFYTCFFCKGDVALTNFPNKNINKGR
jgi:hypothetical protein